MPLSKYVHWPSLGFSIRGSQLQSQEGLVACVVVVLVVVWVGGVGRWEEDRTYGFDLAISSTRVSSPSATWITSSIRPAPI